MSKPNESYIRVSYGEDGNPQIETNCVGLEASKLCVALLDRMTRRALSFRS